MKNPDLTRMAWADKISFDEIKKKTGFSEKEAIETKSFSTFLFFRF